MEDTEPRRRWLERSLCSVCRQELQGPAQTTFKGPAHWDCVEAKPIPERPPLRQMPWERPKEIPRQPRKTG